MTPTTPARSPSDPGASSGRSPDASELWAAAVPSSTVRSTPRRASTAPPSMVTLPIDPTVATAPVETRSRGRPDAGSAGGFGDEPHDGRGGLVGGLGHPDLVGPEQVGHDPQHPVHEGPRPHA